MGKPAVVSCMQYRLLAWTCADQELNLEFEHGHKSQTETVSLQAQV